MYAMRGDRLIFVTRGEMQKTLQNKGFLIQPPIGLEAMTRGLQRRLGVSFNVNSLRKTPFSACWSQRHAN
jgi:hypothetical protein